MRDEAQSFLRSINAKGGMSVSPVFLRKSYGKKWQQQAESRIYSAELVIVYDVDACLESENTKWELECAKKLGKSIIKISREDIVNHNFGAIQSAYDFGVEFENCFTPGISSDAQRIELYKIIVESSENLIRRRQITNGFFTTIVSAIIGGTGFAIKEEIVTQDTSLVLSLPIVIGLLMCRSWKNLIVNYGRLNAGKFKVIIEIEKTFDTKLFSAEWIALGKGLRSEKYRSFTSTEQNVPFYFSCLLCAALLLILVDADWEPLWKGISEGVSWGITLSKSLLSI